MTAPLYNLTDTWNAGGTTFAAIQMNVTNTASATNSSLLQLQVGSADVFKIRKDGVTTWGDYTSSYSAFKQSGSSIATNRLSVRLADDSDWGFLALQSFDVMVSGGSTRGGVVDAGGGGVRLLSVNTAPITLETNSGGNGKIIIGGVFCDNAYSFQTPATGFSITIGDAIWHLILDPAGTLATGTITMAANPTDGQVVNIRSSQAVTALTISPNSGQSVKGAPSTLALGGTLEAIYRTANTTWYF